MLLFSCLGNRKNFTFDRLQNKFILPYSVCLSSTDLMVKAGSLVNNFNPYLELLFIDIVVKGPYDKLLVSIV